jgi:enoyl-CoA hydratase
MSNSVLVSMEGTIGTLTVNRPEALNALNRETLEALDRAIEGLRGKGLRCLIVTGAGDKAFVAGADIAAMSTMTADEGLAFSRLGQVAFGKLEQFECPVIAAVNGFALGGGCELALACDFIIASDKAKFGQPEVKLGVIPGYGGTQRLARRVGPGIARELIYTGRLVLSEEALRLGLVNAVVQRRELMDKVTETARLIAAAGPSAIAAAKRVMRESDGLPLESGLDAEARAFGACFAGAEQKEGMQAFLEKREPTFTG